MYITSNRVLNDYNKLKKLSKFASKIKQYSAAMDLISIAANLMYNFNIIYYDKELESLLEEIAEKKMKKNYFFSPLKTKWFFMTIFLLIIEV
jgi:hypothetical protein